MLIYPRYKSLSECVQRFARNFSSAHTYSSVQYAFIWFQFKVRVHVHELICHKLACVTFPTKIASHYREHSALVEHNTIFATVHSWATVGGYLVEYEHKLLCQFTTTGGGTRCCLWLKKEPKQLRPHEVFLLMSRNKTEQKWLKDYSILARWVPSNFTNYGELEKFFSTILDVALQR